MARLLTRFLICLDCFCSLCCLGILAFLLVPVAYSETPTGGPLGWPGITHRWAPALKQALGTSYESTSAYSPVWFTVTEGAVSEVFYPHSDRVQVGYLEFIVTNGENYFSEQKSGHSHESGTLSIGAKNSEVKFEDEGMAVHVRGEDQLKFYRFDQFIFTDVASPVLKIHTEFIWNNELGSSHPMKVFILLKPTLNNSASANLGTTNSLGLFATTAGDHSKAESYSMALLSSVPWKTTSAGYVGFSDPWQDLSEHFRLTQPWHEVGAGNILLAGELEVPSGLDFTFDLALGFGTTRTEATSYAQLSLDTPYEAAKETYEKGWKNYLARLENTPPNLPKMPKSSLMTESRFARRSAQIIKMHEDKISRGAIVASLSNPTLPSSAHQAEGDPQLQGGYHLVWPRDLYYAAMGLLAAGDLQTPIEVFKYFGKSQQVDGSWPNRYWINGTSAEKTITKTESKPEPKAEGENPSQTADATYAILLAEQLHERIGYVLSSEDQEMIRKATAFILSRGPATQIQPQTTQAPSHQAPSHQAPSHPTEVRKEYNPAILAMEIAALRSAGNILQGLQAELAEINRTADQWQSSVERWTLVQKGPFGNNYYARILGFHDEVFDEGFLKLVRLGIRDPTDPRILNSLKIYEDPSPTHQWIPTLVAQKGFYSIARHQISQAETALSTLELGSTSTGLLPEQLSLPNASSGAKVNMHVRLGVACPLVWAHAEDILLHRSIEEGTIFDAPTLK